MLHSQPSLGFDALSHTHGNSTNTNKLCTDTVLAGHQTDSHTFNLTNDTQSSLRLHQAYRLNAAKAVVNLLSIPTSPDPPRTPFVSCFVGLAFAVFFTERTERVTSSSAGQNSISSGHGRDDHRRDLEEQMGLCVLVLKEQAELFPIVASVIDVVTGLFERDI